MSTETQTDTFISGETLASNGTLNLQGNDEGLKPIIEVIAKQIQENAILLSDYLHDCGYPQPSFERDAPPNTIPEGAPQEIRSARQALIEAALRMFQLAVGPSEYLPNLAVGYQYLTSLHWLTHFKIFSLIPFTGSISYAALASTAGVSERQLKTVARMAMTSNLFCEPTPNHISHSATSALFVTNESYNDWAVFMTEASAPTATKLVEASEKWPGSVEKNQTAYNIAFDTELPFFDHLMLLPDKTKQFAAYMKNVTKSEGMAIDHLLNGFDWASLGKATIVDVGGSTGSASIALAQAFHDLNFIVEDLQENAASGQASLSTLSPKIASRIFFLGHNFFEEQPFRGANVYLLRMILHDWAEHEATKILKNLVPALNSGSRIILMDSVLPRPGFLPSSQERLLRVRDMTMMQAFNSLERDLEDWKDLLKAADERFSLVNVVQPRGSLMSVMEVVFDA